MKTAYIDYSMSVIVSRAIPDVRDGLKPVHRRVLFGMNDLGLAPNRPYKKSARIVGEVLGKYHPHGDSSVYDAMVRMAQDWSLRYPLVDGQGNFGSIDGDNPAAMRYTEARFRRTAEEMLSDIDKDTVDFNLNFDDTLEEPSVLPTRLPNLLVNGASGIAVGMATNILPHNLGEVIDGCLAYIDNNDIEMREILQLIKGPDFPTGGVIYGMDGIVEATETGRGKIVVRGKADIELDDKGRERIIVTEIPYQLNKSSLIMRTAELVNDGKIKGISDIRDESDRTGLRIVYEIKKDANAQVVLNKLYKFTQLQTSYGVNNIALVNGRPKILSTKELIKHFVEFRHTVVVRRTEYELAEAEKKAHILEGYLIALDHLDEVIALIRASRTPDDAKAGLMEKFELSEIQAKAILEMRLQKLTGLEREKIKEEYEELMKFIQHCKDILSDEGLRYQIIKDELAEVKEKYADERRTEIVAAAGELRMEDIIPDDEVVITISHLGYIKRALSSDYKVQGRGGKGSRGGSTRDEDFIEHLLVASNHNYILFFTELGRCYWLKVYEIPEGSKTSKGRPIQNLIMMPKEDKVRSFITVDNLDEEEFLKKHNIVFCTRGGVIKKTILEKFSRPRQNGINAITIKDGDQLIDVKLTDGKNEILIATSKGKAIRFNEEKVRPMGRSAAGVKGVTLDGDDDRAVGMVCVNMEEEPLPTILVVAEQGYGKRSEIEEYRMTNRGGKGVKTLNITNKTGKVVGIKTVQPGDDLMIINRSGITIRMNVDDISVLGRATQGVRLIKLNDGDEIAAIAKVEELDDENGENGNGNVSNESE